MMQMEGEGEGRGVKRQGENTDLVQDRTKLWWAPGQNQTQSKSREKDTLYVKQFL